MVNVNPALEMGHASDTVKHLIGESLLSPFQNYFHDEEKKSHSCFVNVGFSLAHPEDRAVSGDGHEERIKIAHSIVDALRAGFTLAEGHWLHFWSLGQISRLGLRPEDQNQFVDECLNLVLKGHVGQVLHSNTKLIGLSRKDIHDVYSSTVEYRMGSFFSLALRLGGCLFGADEVKKQNLHSLGIKLAQIHQMVEDKNHFSSGTKKNRKRLDLAKPNWIWCVAASFSERIFQDFLEALDFLPNEDMLHHWCRTCHFTERLTEMTSHHFQQIKNEIEREWGETHPTSLKAVFSFPDFLP